jgi:protease IV
MKFIRIAIFVIFLHGFGFSQSLFPSYYSQSEFNLTSPGAMRYGLYGADNPALLTTLSSPDILVTWSDFKGWKSINHWGVFTAVPNFGFSINREKFEGNAVTDYKISAAMGDNSFGLGFGYGWSNGDENFFRRSKMFTAGTFMRPFKNLSLGIIGNFPADGFNEGIIDLAIRPLGNEIISVFADYVFRESRPDNDIKWSAGAAIEPLPGIRFSARYFDNKFISTGLEYSLGRIGLFTQAHFSEDKYSHNTYGIRMGSYDRNLFDHFKKDAAFVEMNLLGGMKYQRFRFLDNSNTLLDFLNYIKASKEDKSSAGVVLNLSGMSINREMVWELRKELLDLKSSGKKVFVYFDRLDINGYHLASVADKIIMDPIGSLTLEGYLFGRTYFTGTLEKIGIGFNELRYFKYKSAYESFAREEMSKADEEQWSKIIDSYYNLARNDISTSRGLSHPAFDEIVNKTPFFLPEDALKRGLIDTIARFDKIQDIIKKSEGDDKYFISHNSLAAYRNPEDNYWGEKPVVAVIYALGVCAMDEGINARQLVKHVDGALTNPNVKAVVLRVDSPGGDALASDLISEKIKEHKGSKPVIISQGYVAGSGGYWLSMYGDTIVAAPNTITGSIGVIGAWVYNKDLKNKLGVATDFIKRGDHADLPFGMTFPLIGLTLPDRNLSEEEEAIFRNSIEKSYEMFVNKVAEGRDLNREKIREIAQGRVWSGVDGKEIGLVDVLGNLNTAIEIAVKKAGLKKDEYQVIEIPEPGFLDFNMFMPRIAGFKLNVEDPDIQNLKFRIRSMGQPMPIIPLDFSTGMILQY